MTKITVGLIGAFSAGVDVPFLFILILIATVAVVAGLVHILGRISSKQSERISHADLCRGNNPVMTNYLCEAFSFFFRSVFRAGVSNCYFDCGFDVTAIVVVGRVHKRRR